MVVGTDTAGNEIRLAATNDQWITCNTIGDFAYPPKLEEVLEGKLSKRNGWILDEVAEVWDTPNIHGKTINQAQQELDQQARRIREGATMNVFGFSVQSRMAAAISAGIELLLLLFIVAYMSYLGSLVEKEDEKVKISEFPAFGAVILYWPSLVAISTSVLLPLVLTNMLILGSLGDLKFTREFVWRWLAALGFSVVYIALGLSIFSRGKLILGYLRRVQSAGQGTRAELV